MPARRGRDRLYGSLDPRKTGFAVIAMIDMFAKPGAPAEVPASRGVVANVNALAGKLRPTGSPMARPALSRRLI